MKEEIIFEKETPVVELDYETLSQTADYIGSAKHPIAHHEMWEEVFNKLDKKNVKYDMPVIYVNKSGVNYPRQTEVIKRGYKSQYDTRGVIVHTMISQLNITNKDASDKEYNQTIAIAYNKLGIEMAMGLNVKICSNLNILRKQNYMRNYGSTGTGMIVDDIEKMITMIEYYLDRLAEKHQQEVTFLNSLKDYTFPEWDKTIDTLTGHLHRLVEEDLLNKTNTLVLRHENIHKFMRKAITEENDHSLYDIYQMLTDVSTHQNTVQNRLPNTVQAAEFIQNYFHDAIDLRALPQLS